MSGYHRLSGTHQATAIGQGVPWRRQDHCRTQGRNRVRQIHGADGCSTRAYQSNSSKMKILLIYLAGFFTPFAIPGPAFNG